MSDAIRKRVVFLDYMRVFAFVSVLIGHKFFVFLAPLATAPDQHISIRLFAEAMIPLCQGGAAGVVVFFLTSGYIITHVLQSEAPADFLFKRIFRIYPLYIFAVAMELAFNAASGVALPDMTTIIQRMLLIGDFFNTPYGLAGVEWTLRIEVAFYLLMFLIKASGLMKALGSFRYCTRALPQHSTLRLYSRTGWGGATVTSICIRCSCFADRASISPRNRLPAEQ